VDDERQCNAWAMIFLVGLENKHSVKVEDENGEEIGNMKEYFEIEEEGEEDDDGLGGG
jgi:hypothetical protein